jgi:hypothetical protein
MEAPAGASFGDAGVAENISGLWRDLRGMAHDHLQLAALEAQRAGRSLVAVLAASIVLGVLLASTLLILTGALILALIEFGVSASFAALLAALVNLSASMALALAIRSRSRLLGFPATLRTLRPTAPTTTSSAAAS